MIALGLAEGATFGSLTALVGATDWLPVDLESSPSLAVVIATALIIVPVFYGDRIVELFLSKDQRGADEVTELALHILIIVAVFQVFDGLQAAGAGSAGPTRYGGALVDRGFWLLDCRYRWRLDRCLSLKLGRTRIVVGSRGWPLYRSPFVRAVYVANCSTGP